jgi:hypothetical protein
VYPSLKIKYQMPKKSLYRLIRLNERAGLFADNSLNCEAFPLRLSVSAEKQIK